MGNSPLVQPTSTVCDAAAKHYCTIIWTKTSSEICSKDMKSAPQKSGMPITTRRVSCRNVQERQAGSQVHDLRVGRNSRHSGTVEWQGDSIYPSMPRSCSCLYLLVMKLPARPTPEPVPTHRATTAVRYTVGGSLNETAGKYACKSHAST